MRTVVIFLLVVCVSIRLWTQEVEQQIEPRDVSTYIRFLASDELQGRKTGEQSNWVAARYIAEQFRYLGVKIPEGTDTEYFQVIPFANVSPPSEALLTVGGKSLDLADRLMVRKAKEGMIKADLFYLPHAMPEEVTMAVKDKIVLTYIGSDDVTEPQAAFALTRIKNKKLKEMGALGIIEIYQGRHPWNLIKRYLGSGGLTIQEEDEFDSDFLVLTIDDKLEDVVRDIKSGKSVQCVLNTDGITVESKASPNVLGIIEGTDPLLRDEYIALSAHYDHVGTSRSSDRPKTNTDSIFNGARDNAFGVAALLSAAKTLAIAPPKRSILLIACTAEEMGLLGSKYFVEHPIIPLDQIVFDLNTDGAGHSDSTIVSVMGLNRVGVSAEIKEACAAFDLETFADPAPEQNLFDRSDNVSFAAVGIPAPTFSPGFREFDKEIMRHYHQPSDEVSSLDFNYVLRFCRAYAFCARLIANKSEKPRWSEGDKYEEAYNHLYQHK
jgi:hypothetical protein